MRVRERERERERDQNESKFRMALTLNLDVFFLLGLANGRMHQFRSKALTLSIFFKRPATCTPIS